MDYDALTQIVFDANDRSRKVLTAKNREYGSVADSLINFKCAGAAQNIPPTQALVGMAAKHFISISQMAKSPTSYNLETWKEKAGDLRNYMILLEALLIDMGVQ